MPYCMCEVSPLFCFFAGYFFSIPLAVVFVLYLFAFHFFTKVTFRFSLEIGYNGYHNERLRGIENPFTRR